MTSLLRTCALLGALFSLCFNFVSAGILEDRAIEDAIHSSFVFRELLADPGMVQLHVRYGAVEVRGQVADEREHLLVGDLIAALPNVRSVDNRLFVDSAHRRATFRWLAFRIRAHLLKQGDVAVEDLAARVTADTILLTGRVRDVAQRDFITAQVRAIDADRSIDNQLEISPALRPRRAPDDASVIALAWGALRNMPTVQLSPRAIASENGHVSLVGIAATPGDLAEITRRVTALRGVRKLSNQVIVSN